MNQTPTPITRPVSVQITLPGSKSITNRALLISAFARGQSVLSGALWSDDTNTFVKALQSLGVKIEMRETDHQMIVHGVGGRFPQSQAAVWCQDAGTAARFLLAACALNPGEYAFDGSPRLRERPQADLLQALREIGAVIIPADRDRFPLILKGLDTVPGGVWAVSGKLSSQFISALLMITPFAQTPVTLQAMATISRPYVSLTCAMMHSFGVAVIETAQGYEIAAPQAYRAQDYLIEPDASTASYFFAAAALTASTITVRDLNRDAGLQGDLAFLSVLEQMGAAVEQTAQGITVQGTGHLHGVDVDLRDFSDTFMTLACLAPFAEDPTTIRGIAHTRLQESDRIEAVATVLTQCGVMVDTGEDWIRIHPGAVRSATVDSHNDHRIAMSAALLGLKVGGITITNSECVGKTCPEYFTLLESLSA